MKNKDRYYKTTNFYLASFLFAKGEALANLEKFENNHKFIFVFVNSPNTEDLIEKYSYSKEDSKEAMVDARKLVLAIKSLKEKLYQDNF